MPESSPAFDASRIARRVRRDLGVVEPLQPGAALASPTRAPSVSSKLTSTSGGGAAPSGKRFPRTTSTRDPVLSRATNSLHVGGDPARRLLDRRRAAGSPRACKLQPAHRSAEQRHSDSAPRRSARSAPPSFPPRGRSPPAWRAAALLRGGLRDVGLDRARCRPLRRRSALASELVLGAPDRTRRLASEHVARRVLGQRLQPAVAGVVVGEPACRTRRRCP